MKAKLQKPEGMGNWVTLAELPIANKLLRKPGEMLGYDREHEDEWFADGVNIIRNIFSMENVITATAELAKNDRADNSLCADSGKFDIWFDVLLYGWISNHGFGYVKVGAYLTDLWQITATNKAELMQHMYIRRFVELN